MVFYAFPHIPELKQKRTHSKIRLFVSHLSHFPIKTQKMGHGFALFCASVVPVFKYLIYAKMLN
jgi:hypothetical protein